MRFDHRPSSLVEDLAGFRTDNVGLDSEDNSGRGIWPWHVLLACGNRESPVPSMARTAPAMHRRCTRRGARAQESRKTGLVEHVPTMTLRHVGEVVLTPRSGSSRPSGTPGPHRMAGKTPSNEDIPVTQAGDDSAVTTGSFGDVTPSHGSRTIVGQTNTVRRHGIGDIRASGDVTGLSTNSRTRQTCTFRRRGVPHPPVMAG